MRSFQLKFHLRCPAALSLYQLTCLRDIQLIKQNSKFLSAFSIGGFFLALGLRERYTDIFTFFVEFSLLFIEPLWDALNIFFVVRITFKSPEPHPFDRWSYWRIDFWLMPQILWCLGFLYWRCLESLVFFIILIQFKLWICSLYCLWKTSCQFLLQKSSQTLNLLDGLRVISSNLYGTRYQRILQFCLFLIFHDLIDDRIWIHYWHTPFHRRLLWCKWICFSHRELIAYVTDVILTLFVVWSTCHAALSFMPDLLLLQEVIHILVFCCCVLLFQLFIIIDILNVEDIWQGTSRGIYHWIRARMTLHRHRMFSFLEAQTWRQQRIITHWILQSLRHWIIKAEVVLSLQILRLLSIQPLFEDGQHRFL